MTVFLLLMAGFNLNSSFFIVIFSFSLLNFISKHKYLEKIEKNTIYNIFKKSINSYFSVVLILIILYKIYFMFWQSLKTDLFFWDSTLNWGSRAKALYYGVNWSFDSNHYNFLGHQFGIANYPLGSVIWRSCNGIINNSWNDHLVKIDGVFFYLIILITTFMACSKISQELKYSFFLTYILASIPLFLWQAPSGYVDVWMAAYACVATMAFINKEFLILGFLVAGMAWIKREGLGVYFPSFFISILFFSTNTYFEKIKNLGAYLLPFLLTLPWFIVLKTKLNFLEYNPVFEFNSDMFSMLWKHLFNASTNGILWIVLPICFLLNFKYFIKLKEGIAILLIAFLPLLLIVFIFSFEKDIFKDISSESGQHRLLLQISPILIICSTFLIRKKNEI
ncbi:MAG: hypothetical protein ACKOAD_00630 [Gammaproteobacteria bacterium]